MADPKEPTPYVQPQAYDAEGKAIDPESIPQAAAEGKAFFQKGAKVYARDRKGELVTIDASDVNHPGYTVLSPAQVEQAWNQKQYGEGLGNVAKAGVAGAARSLTLGASDAALIGLGGEDTRKALKGLKDANPIASTVGEVGGAVAPLLATGGGSAAITGAKAASAGARAAELAGTAVRTLGAGHRALAAAGGIVERGVARGLASLGYEGTTVGSRAAAGALKLGTAAAVESAGYGAAQEANDAVLNGDEITAEKVVSGLGHGALFGAGVGGVLGAAGPLLSGLGSKLIPKKETLEKVSSQQALRSITQHPSQVQKLAGRATGEAAEQRILATGEDLANSVFESGPLKGEHVLKPGANVDEIAPRITAYKDEIGAKIAGVKQEVDDGMRAAGQGIDIGKVLDDIHQQVIKPLLKSDSTGKNSLARTVKRELAGLEAYQAQAKAALEGGEGLAAGPANEVVEPFSFGRLDQYRRDLADKVYPKPGSNGGIPALPPKAMAELQQVERIVQKHLKETASDFLAKAGEDPNAFNELNRQYNSFRQLDQIASKTTATELGRRTISPSDHGVGLTSFLGALATGNVGGLGAMAYGAAAGIANKLLRERGNSALSVMARHAADYDGTIENVAQALAGKATAAKSPVVATTLKGEALHENYTKTVDRIRELASPEMAQAHISSLIPEIAGQYPMVGAAVSTKLLQIYQQLASKIPQSPVDTGQTLTPLAVKSRVSPIQMQAFMSQVKGALAPEEVIRQIGRGVIDRHAVEALKAAHPRTFQQLRTSVANYVSESGTEIPYQRRIMLSMLFDFVGDSSLEPQRLAGLQQASQALSVKDAAKDAAMVKPRRARPRESQLGKTYSLPSSGAFSNGR